MAPIKLYVWRKLVPKSEIDGAEVGTFEVPDTSQWCNVNRIEVRSYNDTMFEVIFLHQEHSDCVAFQLEGLGLDDSAL